MSEPDISQEFYRRYARRYAEVSQQALQSTYLDSSHPRLRCDQDLIERLKELVPPGCRGLDAGCGAEARDVHHLFTCGYDVCGIDAVEENLRTAAEIHPEVAARLRVMDLSRPLDFPDAAFDFVICNAVIQHIDEAAVKGCVLPELARVLRPGGVLLIMFKNGRGILSMYDRHYNAIRSFLRYDEHEVLGLLRGLGLDLIEAEGDKLGGLMYLQDGKGAWHAVMFLRRVG